MPSFPTLSTGSVCTYPLLHTHRTRTRIHHFENDSEQRYRDGRMTNEFVLSLNSISRADYNLVEDFFDARAGSFDTSWDLTIAGATYQHCTFVEDVLTASEVKPNRITASLRIRQTR
jgi:hypothetical protein